MSVADSSSLPPWAAVSDRRREHIERVTALLMDWAEELNLTRDDVDAWRAAGMWHDALRDADEQALRALVPGCDWPVGLLHGPAAAARLAEEGERRAGLLDAIRWHTVGHPAWGRVGRALYMADFLEPGRKFSRGDRAFLARVVPSDFDGVFRQVVRMRIEWALREGHNVHSQTIELWNAVR